MPGDRYIVLLLLSLLFVTSCYITDNIGTMHIEVMKPGIVNIPIKADTLAIINRDIFSSDTSKFIYFDGQKMQEDSTINYNELANICIDEVANSLIAEGYFRKVYNYHDSLNDLWKTNQPLTEPEELFKKTKSNACLFLDYFTFNHNWINYHWDKNLLSAQLSWTIIFKGDTLAYFYNQNDSLIYYFSQIPSLKKGKSLNPLLKNSAMYLGQSLGSKLVPTWMNVDRMYYKSGNQFMRKAEKLALNDDWLSAAEIWNQMSKNKNKVRAAKASFNMALACEIEGKPDLAIDWLINSYGKLSRNNEDHRVNCRQYINVLATRRKDFEKLGKQIRNPEMIQNTEPSQ